MKKICLLLMVLVCCVAGRTALATDYSIYKGTCTVDGNLNDWSGATWINLSTLYYGTVTDVVYDSTAGTSNAKFAVRWSPSTNLIYVAVTVEDTAHHLAASADVVGGSVDKVDVYIDPGNLDKYSYCYNYSAYGLTAQYWKYAQQYVAGLKDDNTVWAALAGQSSFDSKTTESISSGILAGFAASVSGNTYNYEFAIKPYRYFNIDAPSTSNMVTLKGGSVIGFDVTVETLDDNAVYGYLSENANSNKYVYAYQMQSWTLKDNDPSDDYDIEFVKVDNANNAADTTGYGAVDHSYYIGKYEVTTIEYARFLNAVAYGSDPYTLYNATMLTNYSSGPQKIAKTPNTDGTYKYTVLKGLEWSPISYINWTEAARYCNYLTTGNTETGVYVFTNGVLTSINNDLKTGSTKAYWIPTQNEWYKAAYYDGDAGVYYDYPTGSDTLPALDFQGTNSCNWKINSSYNALAPYLQNKVGAFVNTTSPCGAYDMAGNVEEFFEVPSVSSTTTYMHGCAYAFTTTSYMLAGSFESFTLTSTARYATGFRLATNEAGYKTMVKTPGDANRDSAVDVTDLSVLAAYYNTTSGATWAMGDFDDDGAVTVTDLSILAANYNSGSSSTLSWADAYAQAFGTSADDDAADDSADEETSSSVCGSLGLSLIAGLALMGLMIVKLEE
jgi:hypothetical protein